MEGSTVLGNEPLVLFVG